MNENVARAGAAAALFAAWAGMVYLQVPHSEDFVAFCKLSLTALGAHWATSYVPDSAPTLPPGTTQTTIVPGAKQ